MISLDTFCSFSLLFLWEVNIENREVALLC
jgi:hypothetical protein